MKFKNILLRFNNDPTAQRFYYADSVDKKIKQLEKKIDGLKNCANCRFSYDSGFAWFCLADGKSSQNPDKTPTFADKLCEKWRR